MAVSQGVQGMGSAPGEAQLEVLLEGPSNLVPFQHLHLVCWHALDLVRLWHALAGTLERDNRHTSTQGIDGIVRPGTSAPAMPQRWV